MGILDTLFGKKQIAATDQAGHDILAAQPPPIQQVAIDSPGTPGQFNPFAVDGLQNLVTGLGSTRDKSTYNQYVSETGVDRVTADAIFRSSWLGRRLVTTVADDMVRKWRKIKWDGMDKGKAEKGLPAIMAEEKRVFLRKRVHQAIKWSRLYGGSIIVMMIKGQGTAVAMEQPLEVEKLGKDCLTALLVFDRWRVYGMPPSKVATIVGQTSADPAIVAPYLNQSLGDPNFGLPEYYFLADSSVRVHHTRCIRFNGEELPWYEWMRNALWDDSVYRNIMPAVQNYDAVIRGGATLITEASQDVLSAEGLADRLATEEGTAQVTRRYQLLAAMKSLTHMLVIDKDRETYERKPATFSGIAQMQDKASVDVAGAFDIPMTRLFGQSPGGLNSTGDSDLANYDDHIAARRELDLGPQIEKLDQVLIRSALGAMPPNYQSEFVPLRQLNETEAAQVRLNKANGDKIWFDMGVATEGLIARERSNDGSFATMEDDDVKMATELGEANYEKALEDIENPPAPVVPAAFGTKPGKQEPGAKGEPGKEEEDESAAPSGKPQPRVQPRSARNAKDWDPDQPRDADGKWGEGGGSASGEGGGASGAGSKSGGPSAHVISILEAKEAKIADEGREHGLLIDNNGVVIAEVKGRKDSVRMGPESVKASENAHFTHNHPSGVSLSDRDFNYAVEGNLATVRAVGRDPRDGAVTVYSFNRPSGGWPVMAPYYRRVTERGLKSAAQMAYKTPEGLTPQKWAQLVHDRWVKLQGIVDVGYHVEKRPG